MFEKETLELVAGATAATSVATKGDSYTLRMEEEGSRKNWALETLVTPINHTSLGPTLRLLVRSENKSPIV